MNTSLICHVCNGVAGIIASHIKIANVSEHTASMIALAACAATYNATIIRVCDEVVKSANKITQYVCAGLSPGDACKKIGLC